MAEFRNENATGILRGIFNASVPENLRFFASYLYANLLDSAPDQITEENFSDGVLQVLEHAIGNAKKKGRRSVQYEDYPDLSNGMTAMDFVGKGDSTKRTEQYPDTIFGKLKLAMDSYDPALAAVTSLGAFNFTDNGKGTYNITDRYDFGAIKPSVAGDAYRGLRELAGVDPTKQELRWLLVEYTG
jgi:hypothetical protein